MVYIRIPACILTMTLVLCGSFLCPIFLICSLNHYEIMHKNHLEPCKLVYFVRYWPVHLNLSVDFMSGTDSQTSDLSKNSKYEGF
jgi:hypothetical protein